MKKLGFGLMRMPLLDPDNDASVDVEKVRQMVERQKEKYGWEFLFLGANMDAIETAGRFGIAADRAVNYNSDAVGTALNYEVLADTVCEMRASAAPIDGSWKRRIEADFDRRGGRK